MNLVFLARQHSAPSGKVHEYLLTAEEELERVSHIARQTLGYYKDTVRLPGFIFMTLLRTYSPYITRG
jgi:hypothetical protein